MKWVQHPVLKFFTNRYILVIVVLAIWLLFFDKNDFFTQMDRKQQVEKLEKDVQFYKDEIRRNKEALEQLQSDTVLLEKFAREHYLMKKDNEEIYVIVEDTIPTGK
jgi:cell division protein DivIC